MHDLIYYAITVFALLIVFLGIYFRGSVLDRVDDLKNNLKELEEDINPSYDANAEHHCSRDDLTLSLSNFMSYSFMGRLSTLFDHYKEFRKFKDLSLAEFSSAHARFSTLDLRHLTRTLQYGSLMFESGDRFRFQSRDGIWTLARREGFYTPAAHTQGNDACWAVLTNGAYVEDLGVAFGRPGPIAPSAIIAKMGPIAEWVK